MTTFDDLPLELLPEIIHQLGSQEYISSACLVHPDWLGPARTLLYAHIYMGAYDNATAARIAKLIYTLSESPHLGPLVQSLDIHGWSETISVEPNVANQVFKHCINMRRLSWFTQNPAYFDVLGSLPKESKLSELEFDCFNEGDEELEEEGLLKVSGLKRLSINTINSGLATQLVRGTWFKDIGPSLTSLSFGWDHISLQVTDAFIRSLAPHLPNLEGFHVTRCRLLSHEALLAILAPKPRSRGQLKELTLKYMSRSFDLTTLAPECVRAGYLRELTSISLDVEPDQLKAMGIWEDSVMQLLQDCGLKKFWLEASRVIRDPPGADRICTALVNRHSETLTLISLTDISISAEVFCNILSCCPNLKRFNAGIFEAFETCADTLKKGLSHARKLRLLDIDFSLTEHQVLTLIRDGPVTLMSVISRRHLWRVVWELGPNSSIRSVRVISLT